MCNHLYDKGKFVKLSRIGVSLGCSTAYFYWFSSRSPGVWLSGGLPSILGFPEIFLKFSNFLRLLVPSRSDSRELTRTFTFNDENLVSIYLWWRKIVLKREKIKKVKKWIENLTGNFKTPTNYCHQFSCSLE